jgi:hypothetical protein
MDITFGCGTVIAEEDLPNTRIIVESVFSGIAGVVFQGGELFAGHLFEGIKFTKSDVVEGDATWFAGYRNLRVSFDYCRVVETAPQENLSPENQRAIANVVIQQLRKHCPKACLAGGALFSWEMGESANDLDFFVYMPDWLTTHEVRTYLSEALDIRLHSLSNDMYDANAKSQNGVHKVFEGHMQGAKVQIICCDSDPMKVMKKFPYSHSQMCYDGEEIYYGEHWGMLRDFGIVIRNYQPSDSYKNKIEPRLAKKGYSVANNSEEALDLMMEFMTQRKQG